MKIYDISQEVLSSSVYPGDPSPSIEVISDMSRGDPYNLTKFSMCAHNGTHLDAPRHFIEGGKTIGKIDLTSVIGVCYVAESDGPLDGTEAQRILDNARKFGDASSRILIKGKAEVTEEAAAVFRDGGVRLIGVESQSVGPLLSPMKVHKILLDRDVLLLEGLRLGEIKEGVYTLFAAPINLGEAEGAPCRAVLIE
jgi:arylformamidase